MQNFFPNKKTSFLKGSSPLVFTLAFLLVFSIGSYALAARVTPYTPGETLDPTDCSPGDANCYVSPVYPLTAGGLVFTSSTGTLTQDNSSLFFDDTNDRLGLGTTAPSSILHLNAASGLNGATPVTLTINSTNDGTWTDEAIAAQILFNTSDSTNTAGTRGAIKLYADNTTGADNGLSFYTTTAGAGGIAERMRIDHQGFVGIGTTAPASALHVLGTTTLRPSSEGGTLLSIGRGTDTNIMWTVTTGSGNTNLHFNSTSQSNVLFLGRWESASNQFVGINTATAPADNDGAGPRGALIVSNTSATRPATTGYMPLAVVDGSSPTTDTGAGIDFMSLNATGSTYTPVRIKAHYETGGSRLFGMGFYGHNDTGTGSAGLFEAFRFKSNGDMGIGTGATVSARLHVIKTTEQMRIGYDSSNYYSTTVGSTGGVTLNAVGSGSLFTFSDSVVISGANSINFDNAAGVNITGSAGVATNVLIGTSNTAASSGVGRTIVGSVNTVNAAANYSTIVGRTNALTSAESEATILGNFNTLTDADSGHIIIGGTNTTNFTGGSTSRGTFNIGYFNSVAHNFSSIIGSYQTTTATNQLIIADANDNNNGPESAGYNDVYFGTGPRRSAAGIKGSNVTINGSGAASATATDVAGGHLTIAGGKGTGAGTSGDVYISTATALGSGTTLQSLTQRMVVEGNTGDVGIGDLTPSYRLEVANDVADYVTNIFNDGNAATRSGLRIQAGLDDHTAAGPSTLIGFFDGDGGAVGSITFGSSATAYNTTSDQRLKQNIVDTALSIDLLNQIQIRDYSFIADSTNTTRHGVLAQELHSVYPDAVTVPTNPNEYWMVDYSKLTPLLVKAVQDIDVKIEGLDPTTNTSFASKFVAYFANTANGIGDFFANRVHTQEICLGQDGNETCISKTQLDALLQGTSGGTSGGTGSSSGTTSGGGTTSGTTGGDSDTGSTTAGDTTGSESGTDTGTDTGGDTEGSSGGDEGSSGSDTGGTSDGGDTTGGESDTGTTTG